MNGPLNPGISEASASGKMRSAGHPRSRTAVTPRRAIATGSPSSTCTWRSAPAGTRKPSDSMSSSVSRTGATRPTPAIDPPSQTTCTSGTVRPGPSHASDARITSRDTPTRYPRRPPAALRDRQRPGCTRTVPGACSRGHHRGRGGGIMGGQYDFVIVGGGSAGSALGNRLSSDPSNRVLLREAGRPDYIWDVFIHMPAALPFPIGSRFYDWKYESEPEPYMNGRRIYHARGKVLGGSSSINGMIFQRGNPLDYERWASDPGMETWDYAHCLPYFKRME